MATLVSPGVSVSVVNESFYIPASAPTVPLIFLATQANKMQPDGETAATGTQEHDVVRTVTSIGQSVQLYGNPYFWTDEDDNPHHGDARNEYGLFALNQFLGVGNLAYVVRADIDLTDASESFVSAGTPVASTPEFSGVGTGTLTSPVAEGPEVQPETITVYFTSGTEFTVRGSDSGIIGIGTIGIVTGASASTVNFTSSKVSFTLTQGTGANAVAFTAGDSFTFELAYAAEAGGGNVGNGTITAITPLADAVATGGETLTITFTSATEFTVTTDGDLTVSNGTITGSTLLYTADDAISFRITVGSTAFEDGDVFTISLSNEQTLNQLGEDDAAKRTTIVQALAAAINSNTDVRSEIYEYNLILCPGYPEVVTNLLALSADVNDEAFVIADTPMDLTPEQTAQWALTNDRFSSTNVAYYYPSGLAANLDGATVAIAASGIALRTYAYSDNQSYVWFAPAGVSRGIVTGVNNVGYVTGELGGPTTWVEANLNQGQRDNLYEFFKNINPIVFFPGQGLIVWGQKTSAPAASALDRVNVVRLVMYVKRQLRKGSFPFVFEPNDKITRDNLKAAADGFLNDILAKRGLYDFVTLCDTSNNTPSVIDRNEMYLDVALKPVKAAEFIYVPIRVLSTGAAMP